MEQILEWLRCVAEECALAQTRMSLIKKRKKRMSLISQPVTVVNYSDTAPLQYKNNNDNNKEN